MIIFWGTGGWDVNIRILRGTHSACNSGVTKKQIQLRDTKEVEYKSNVIDELYRMNSQIQIQIWKLGVEV